jgi:hypothetical protein
MNERHHDDLRRLLRASFGPAPDRPPDRDLWPDLAARLHRRRAVSRVDWALTGAVIAGLSFAPQQIAVLLWHL